MRCVWLWWLFIYIYVLQGQSGIKCPNEPRRVRDLWHLRLKHIVHRKLTARKCDDSRICMVVWSSSNVSLFFGPRAVRYVCVASSHRSGPTYTCVESTPKKISNGRLTTIKPTPPSCGNNLGQRSFRGVATNPHLLPGAARAPFTPRQ